MEPMSGRWTILAPGVAEDPLSAPQAIVHFTTPDFFATLLIPIRHGRAFGDQDTEQSQPVAIISESLANRLWPGQSAIGRRVTVQRVDRVVVGVAGTISVRSLEAVSDPQIYFPSDQLGTGGMYYAPRDLMVRVSGDPLSIATAVRRVVHDVDGDQAISDLRRLSDIVLAQTAPRRDQLIVLGTFAVIAFLLAGVGIHGLLSFTVSARTQEIGVRVALGAARGSILGMFLRQGLLLGLGGAVVAVPLAYAAARGMGALLFGVAPGDPWIYAVAAVVAITMTLAGSFRPAVRAAVIDPARTMRTE
jgi:putative ABC transport system permease protein